MAPSDLRNRVVVALSTISRFFLRRDGVTRGAASDACRYNTTEVQQMLWNLTQIIWSL